VGYGISSHDGIGTWIKNAMQLVFLMLATFNRGQVIKV